MKKTLFSFLLLSSSLFCSDVDPFQQVNLTSEPSAFVEGCVNAITGDYVLQEHSLMVQGIEPIMINLRYVSSHPHGVFSGWSFQNNVSLIFHRNQGSFSCSDKNGARLSFTVDRKRAIGKDGEPIPERERKKNKIKREDRPRKITTLMETSFEAVLDEEVYKTGLCHCPYYDASGRINLRNTKAIYHPYGSEITVISASGTLRFYSKASKQKKHVSEKHPDCFDDDEFLPWEKVDDFYLLRYEKLTNGNQIRYGYDENNHLIEIRSTNGEGTKTYAWVKFAYLENSSHSRACEITTSDDKKVTLTTRVRHVEHKKHDHPPYLVYNRISSMKWPGRPWEYYSYLDNRLISRKKSSRDFQEIQYYSSDGVNDLGFKKVKLEDRYDPVNDRVLAISRPEGKTYNSLPTSRFIYHPQFDQNGWASTEVYDVNDTLTQYRYKNDFRLYEVSQFENRKIKTPYRYKNDFRLYEVSQFENRKIKTPCKKKITFSWGKEGSSDVTFLLAKTLWDEKTPKISHRYYYDYKGNVIQERIFGNISGEDLNPLLLDKDNLPKENCSESFATRRKFSKDGKNLLIEEEDDSGVCAKITYYGTTDLIESKLVLVDGEIKMRNFFEYNRDNILIKTSVDDGKSPNKEDLEGVSERKLMIITPKQEEPFYGMPEVIEECFLDMATQEEKLIKKKVIHYSSKGYIEKEDVFDANGQYRYSCSVTYDKEGLPVAKTNPLGETETMGYDKNLQENYHQSFGKDIEEVKKYDFLGRQIEKIKRGSDKTVQFEKYSYDRKGNIISSINHLGHETRFSYSPFGELVEEISPNVLNGQLQPYCPIKKMSYDGLGRKIAIIDPKGQLTKFSYNAFNDPILIKYPDGSCERSIYNLDGTVKIQIDPLGTEVHYTYDFMKRVTSTQRFSKEGELLTEEFNTYNAFHQLSKTDANGIKTLFFYDGAGRKIREEREEFIKDIEYDSLGREYKEILHLPSGKIINITEKDLLDRVIEERVEDDTGNVQSLEKFTYDAAGNKTAVIRFQADKECITTYTYDSFNRLIKKVDALGNASFIAFDDNYQNSFKAISPRTITTDPLGRKTVETIDALGRKVLVEKFSKENVPLSHEEFSYDETGNATQELRWVISNGRKLSEQVIVYTFDAMNRKTTQIEAANSSYPKRTLYDYDKKGHLIYQKNPNGLELFYAFDALGRNVKLSTSDGKCSYEYSYDRMGNLLESTDLLTNQKTYREYDVDGRITYEKLANGLWLQNSYDPIGRKTAMLMPDNSSVHFYYQGSYLSEISRRAVGDEELYCHRFTDYDLSGNCLQQEMIGALGFIKRSFSPLGQINSISSPYTKQKVTHIDAVGKIRQLQTSSSLYQEDVAYVYDDMDHLISESGGLFSHDYSCDSLSNRLSKDAEIYFHNELNELLSTQDREYTYDPNGNPLSIRTKNKIFLMEHDSLDRLISLTIPQEMLIVFTYDSFHRRIGKEKFLWSNGRWEQESHKRYLFDEEKELGEVDEEGDFVSLRVLNPENASEINGMVAIELLGSIYAPIHDICGSVLGLVSIDTKRFCVHYCYSAFGEHIKKINPQDAGDFFDNPWMYSSKRFDRDMEMYFFGRRFYDPEVGSWLTPDPAGFTDGPNLYAYVRHSPITYIDHYGLWCESIDFNVSIELSDGNRTVSMPIQLGNKPISEQFSQNERDRINNYRETWARPCSVGAIDGKEIPNRMIIFMNGINTNLRETQSYARMISDLAGGVQVFYVHNATNGLVKDTKESKKNFFDREVTEPGIVLAKVVRKFLSQDPKNEVLLILHSQATIIGRNYLESEDKPIFDRISVCSVAPAAYTSWRKCKEVVHLVSRGDFVPYFGWVERLFFAKTIIKVNAASLWPLTNHSFSNKAYEPQIRRYLKKFIYSHKE